MEYASTGVLACARSRIAGPRQCGKTTLARAVAATHESTCFDLESEVDLRRLPTPRWCWAHDAGLSYLTRFSAHPPIQRPPRVGGSPWCRRPIPHSGKRFAGLGPRRIGVSRRPRRVHRIGRFRPPRDRRPRLAATVAAWRSAPLIPRGVGPRQHDLARRIRADIPGARHPPTRHFHSACRDAPILDHAGALARADVNTSVLGRSMWATDKTVWRYLDKLTGPYMVRQVSRGSRTWPNAKSRHPRYICATPGSCTRCGVLEAKTSCYPIPGWAHPGRVS